MDKARSRDATEIAFERLGEGWPVILVSGATTDRAIHASLAELLATRLHHAQLRPSGPRRQRRHPAVRGRARNRGHRRRDRHSRRIGRGLRQLLGRGSRHASCGGGPPHHQADALGSAVLCRPTSASGVRHQAHRAAGRRPPRRRHGAVHDDGGPATALCQPAWSPPSKFPR